MPQTPSVEDRLIAMAHLQREAVTMLARWAEALDWTFEAEDRRQCRAQLEEFRLRRNAILGAGPLAARRRRAV